jgi:hypothetical protein
LSQTRKIVEDLALFIRRQSTVTNEPRRLRAVHAVGTGVTFGAISALFGLNHGIINQMQYSHLVAVVTGTAVMPTAIANAWFVPRHLLPRREAETKEPVW